MNRHGFQFRLVDLLAAVTVLIMLMGLLLPVVHSSRTPARRSQCASCLGELTKAMQQFEIAKKRYPGYLEAFGRDSSGSCKTGSWAVALFPYIEQEPLYDEWQDPSTTADWNSGAGFGAANVAKGFYANINLFNCAADSVSTEEVASNSYACNAGFFPDSQPIAYGSMNAHEIALRTSAPENGVFSNQLPALVATYYTGGSMMAVLGSRATQPTNSSHIQDGLTQTIAFSENLQADGWGYVGRPKGWRMTTVGTVAYAGDDLDPVASPRVHTGLVWLYRAQPGILGVNPAKKTNKVNGNRYSVTRIDKDSARPSSGHAGIVNVAMLGGSVSSMSDKTDYVVYQALLTPNTQMSDVPDRSYVLKEADYAN